MRESVQDWLALFLEAHGGVAGTVHAVSGELLELEAAVRIPEPVLKVTQRIPKGKGMAGLAWERARPVSTCNLQTDETGDVRPGARAVNAQAAAALPVLGDDGSVAFVVGIAFGGDRDITDAELAALSDAARAVRAV